MNIYAVIAMGNQSIQDDSHLAPMNALVPEWLCVANNCTIYEVTPFIHNLLMKNGATSAGIKIYTTLVQTVPYGISEF